tara:strand:- start:160 stop:618 length:459 start_codon:yes stop_codon:yes gene_type:complete
MKYRFTGRIKVGSDIFSKGQRLAWLIVTPFNKDEHVVQKPAQQRTIEDFLLDDIHALNKDCSSIDSDYDLVQTTCFVWRCCSHSGSIVEQRLVQKCTLEHTKRFTSNGFEICNGDNGNPLGGFLIQCVHPNYYPRIRESPPIHVESKSKIFL